MNFNVEIIQGENGYVVYEGNLQAGPRIIELRKFWVAESPQDLAELIERLAYEARTEGLTDEQGTKS